MIAKNKTHHEELIDALVASDRRIKRNGFRAALFQAMHGVRMKNSDAELRAHFNHECPAIVPDAYLIDLEEKEVYCYEVSITSRFVKSKADRYIDLWWFVDYTEFELIVVDVDDRGAMRPFDPFASWYRSDKRPVFGSIFAELFAGGVTR